ncbi:hypothetical protein D6P11_14065 [Listeria monocytogenes]|nr:hypothetical protein [Listeria monocytogenes]
MPVKIEPILLLEAPKNQNNSTDITVIHKRQKLISDEYHELNRESSALCLAIIRKYRKKSS